MPAPTILQGNRVFEIKSGDTPYITPTLKDNNGNVWANVVINCDCTDSTIQLDLPSIASLGNTLECEIIINKTSIGGLNIVNIRAFNDGLNQDFIGSAPIASVVRRWSSAILRPASSNSWAIELSV
jgi:hypothetical protein